MHPASLWKPLKHGNVQCRLCSHFCMIEPGRRGKCGVRENTGGELFTLVYDRAAAINVDPVEKKPLYHFLPGTHTLSLGTMGCNLECSFCQNFSLSQPPRLGRPVQGERVSPEALVEAALHHGCQSISYTYSEPTVFFELMRDTAVLARSRGLRNIIVSNGFMSPECLDELDGLMDAANIDLKGFTPDFYEITCRAKLEPVKENLVRIHELGWWLEVTTLLIPGLNDSEEELRAMAGFLVEKLGPGTPWHLSRFHPDFRMNDRPPTPPETLEKAWAIGREAGLEYVYVGNLPGNSHNSTLCPGCGKEAVSRAGFTVTGTSIQDGACGHCGASLSGRFS